jgi:glycosyltransferase involved in cell wall biosynthesis
MTGTLVSVVIPAFNSPEYTRKTIDSVMRQTHRPIEVILSDDNSPLNLKEIADTASSKCGLGFEIKYFRQNVNLNYYWNLQFVLSKAAGTYIMLLDHDDWLVDCDFFADSIKAIEEQPNCLLSIANTLLENTPQTILDLHYGNWHYVSGPSFIKSYLFGPLHPSRSAVMLRFDKLKELQYERFFLDKTAAGKMKIMPDEAFVLICLLASIGKIALSGRVVSVRGLPPESLSRTNSWHKSGGLKMFVPHFLLYRYFKEINCADGVEAMSRNLLLRYPCNSFNLEMIRYLSSSRLAIVFMVLGIFIFNLNRVALFPRKAWISLRFATIYIVKKLLTRAA